MSKRRVTVALEEGTLRALDCQRLRTGQSRSKLIDQALARQIAGDALDRIWADAPVMTEDEAMDLAYSELRTVRDERGKLAAS